VFLYSLWGAIDTLLGYDFHYVGISNLLEHVSRTNLNRRERRRRWFGGWSDKDNTGP
jgi:chloramphenicol 3-O-phosphotransferase